MIVQKCINQSKPVLTEYINVGEYDRQHIGPLEPEINDVANSVIDGQTMIAGENFCRKTPS